MPEPAPHSQDVAGLQGMHAPVAPTPRSPAPNDARVPMLRPSPRTAGPLVASSRTLNLSDRLLADKFVTRRGSQTGVILGVAVALVGVAGYAALRVALLRDLPMPFWWWEASALLVALGLGLAVLFLLVPPTRRVRIRLAPSQVEEWARVQREARALRAWSWVGVGAAATGMVFAAVARDLFDGDRSMAAAGVGVAVALAGLGVLAAAMLRRGLLQRLYVQSLVLSRLEQTGLGPSGAADPRVAPVLKALDQLLGALPESAVRRFLTSDEATQYLDLLDDVREGRHG